MGLPINAYHYIKIRRKLSDNKKISLIKKQKLSSIKMYYHNDCTLSGVSYSYNTSIKDISYDHTGNDTIDGIIEALRYETNHYLNEISKMSDVLKGGTIRKPRELRIPQRISRLGLLYNPYGLID